MVDWQTISGAEQYRLYRDGEAIATTSDSEFLDADLVAGVDYRYAVVAFNDCGDSSPTPTAIGSCLPELVEVWPGDLDDSGEVTVHDVVALATHWERTGPARADRDMAWRAHAADCWSERGGSFADADGSGRVDMGDLLAICLNWQKAHAGGKSDGNDSGSAIDGATRERLRQIHDQLDGAATGPEAEIKAYLAELLDIELPRVFAVEGNSPNPFNPSTSIRYALPAASQVRITIYGLDGRLIRILLDSRQDAGRHSVAWDGRDAGGRVVAAGAYVYRVSAGNATATSKMLLVK